MTPLVPLHPGPHGWEDSSFSVLPFFSGFLLLSLVLLGLTALYLWRRGTLPKLFNRPSPEDDAKRILAERFARGDINSDEFLERSSILNWTPGSEPMPAKSRKNRRI
jgi:putative membrane protein